MRERWPTKKKEWDPVKSEALDLLACEKLVMRYMKDKEEPITKKNLFDFRKYIQTEKASIKEKRED